MSSKSKSKVSTPKVEEFNEKEFQSSVTALVEKLMTHTLRGTSLTAPAPENSADAETLYQQVRAGFSLLSEIDDFCGMKVDELARFMQKLTENRYKQEEEVEPEAEPNADENVVNDDSDNEEPEEKTKKSDKKADKKSKKDESDEEEVVEEKTKKSDKKSKK